MIISQTPLRVSLLGGGTDQPEWFMKHDGAVVGGTIDKYIYVILSKRFDDKIVVGYSKQEEVSNVTEIQHDLVREAAKLAGMGVGWEVKTMSDIPSGGSGLGSSSAILVGLLKAFYEYNGETTIPNRVIANQAYLIERGILKRPVGKQDHYYPALGGKRFIEFVGDSVYSTKLEFPDRNLHMYYTGITRKSTPILQEQVDNISTDNEPLYRTLAKCANSFALGDSSYKEYSLPLYLSESWYIKQKLATSISNPEIEEMCALASKGGASAYKVLGAGGGGFLLVYCKNENLDKFRDVMQGYKELPFKFVDHGTRIVFNND